MLRFHIVKSGFTFAIDERCLSCPFVFPGGEVMEKRNSPRARREPWGQAPGLATSMGHGDSCPPPAAAASPRQLRWGMSRLALGECSPKPRATFSPFPPYQYCFLHVSGFFLCRKYN